MAVLADADKRSRALDPAASFHLTAPAGSGKTFLLAARFLRLLGLVSNPRQILALTFTNKAAAEMRQRIRGCLEKASRGIKTENPAEAELLEYAAKALAAHKQSEELLLAGEILDIRTFHSFCYAIASRAPLEAGIPPGSSLMDDNEQEFFLHETVNETLQEIASRKEGDPARRALMNRLLHLNNYWRALADEIKDLVRKRGGLLDLVQAVNRDRASGRIEDRVRALVETELEGIRADFEHCELGCEWPLFIEEIGRAGCAAANDLPARIPIPKWEDLPLWVCMAEALLTKEGSARRQFGPKSGFQSGFKKSRWGCAIQDIPPETAQKLHLVRQLPQHGAPPTDLEALWDLIVLLNAVLQVYDERRDASRSLDYAALELAALRLFDSAEPSDLQLILDQQIRHILVDEFQDTSREQWELLQKMCAGWSDGDGRTLFVVGDPKQSIYSFRKAEVKLFLDARLGLPVEGGGKVSLEPLVLNTNFRSQPHLIEWCNGVFEKTVMADPMADYDEVPFSPSKLSPETAVGPDPAPVELALFMDWPSREMARQREAGWLAGSIAGLMEKNGRDVQAAILLFSRTHLSVYLEALQRRKIPIQVKEGLKLSDRPEVRYLWQLCRGIVLPHDDIAWASQLRSPWFSLDFDRIFAISAEEPVLWVEKIGAFAKHDDEVGKFWESLEGARQHTGHRPLVDVVEAAWLELGGAREVGARWGSRGLGCCRRFLRMLREAEQGEPVGTLARLEQLLDKAYEPVDPDTASSNIFLSTVHGAKGLEFDSVFIPFLDWNPESGRKELPPPYILERAGGGLILATRPDRLTGEKSLLYEWLRRLRLKRQSGEAKRLFYVAVTRARRQLVMSGLARKKENSFSTAGEGPLGWLSRHYGIDALCGLDRIACPEEADSADVAAWKSSARSEDGFLVHVEPDCGEFEETPAETARQEMAPAEFELERPLFTVISPSDLAVFNRGDHNGREEPPADAAPLLCPPVLWGTLIHALLAEFGKKGTLPSSERTAATVRRFGIDGPRSLEIASSALSEVRSCLDDPWLQAFYSVPPGRRKIEWPVECIHRKGVIYSGVIDLAAEIEGQWCLVDFKTSRPLEGEPVEDFLRAEIAAYRPQVLSYREICAKLTGRDQSRINAFIYWTGLGKSRNVS